jgi:RNA polymerase sigma-70 factor (ECF subfamily)
MVIAIPLAWLARDALSAGEPIVKTEVKTEAEPEPAASASERVQRLVRDHLAAVWRTARDLGVAPCDLDDVAQEVLMVVLRRIDQVTPGRERAFAVAAAVRVSANWRRRRRRKPLTVTDDVDALHSLATRDRATPAEAELALERSRKLELLRSALGEMSEKDRAAFVLFELEELSAPEIACELGLSESAVMSRVRRARTVLERALEHKRRLER